MNNKKKTIIIQQPIDMVVKNFSRALGKETGYTVIVTESFRSWYRGIQDADIAIVNTTKFDDPRFSLRLLASIITARLSGVPVINIFTTDLYDLCETVFLKPLIYFIQFLNAFFSNRVLVLESRQHILRRYLIPQKKAVLIQNYVNNEFWDIGEPNHTLSAKREVILLYHGELLWWHGLERFEPILEELQKYRPVRLIVAGMLYPSAANILGIPLSSREREIKRRLKSFLENENVEWLGKVSSERLKELMARAVFHVTQLACDTIISATEVRTCLLEALSAGLPCLHIRTQALSRLPFRDRENIVYVDPSTPSEAAETIRMVYEDRTAYVALRKGARKIAREYFDFDAWYHDKGLPLVRDLTEPQGAVRGVMMRGIDYITRIVGVPFYFTLSLITGCCARNFIISRKITVDFQELPLSTEPREIVEPPERFPFVSIIVPIFRSEKTLERCLDSLMNLRYPEEKREIIIVDNNSPDDSRRIAEQYRVKIIREVHQGRAYARNAGIRAAQGDYIAFTDSDCIVEPDWLTKYIKAADRNPECGIFGGDIESCCISETMRQFFHDEGILSQHDAISGKMLGVPFVVTANAFIRKTIFNETGLFDTRLITAEDTEWGWRAHFKGWAMRYCPEIKVWHFHPLSLRGVIHQFYEYGENETYVFLKHKSHLSQKELSQRFWFMPWTYRRFYKTCFILPFKAIMDYNGARIMFYYIVKELAYRAGRLHANFKEPETWEWFNLFVED